MKKFGIDVSKWQGNFNFSKAIAEGVEFVVIKGGGADDGLYIDPKFKRNYNSAKAKGLPVGCYWFSKATTIEAAEKEAEYFYKNILKGRQFELPVYMDVEHKAMREIGRDKLTAVVKAFCEKMESYGCWVGVYSTAIWFNTYMNDSELQCYAHWVAEWDNDGCSYVGPEGVLGMWQFGGETNLVRTNKVAGVVCDQNYMYIDYPAKIKAEGLNGFAKPTTTNKVEEKPKPALKSTKEIVAEIIAGKWGVGTDRKKRLEAAGYDYGAIQTAVNIAMGKVAEHKTIKKGDKVKVIKNIIYGTNKAFTVYYDKYDVLDVDGDRVVIGIGRATTAAVSAKNLLKV